MQGQPLTQRVANLDWGSIESRLSERGFAVTPPILNSKECSEIIERFGRDDLYRSTIDMRRYNFGKGSYRYFHYPLPEIVQTLRTEFYVRLNPAANLWAERLKMEMSYPDSFEDFQKVMQKNQQTRPTPLILRYEKGDYNCLHQDIANDLVFPFQIVLGLSEPGADYQGGHLILTQQRPRMQTIPHIIAIPRGAAVILSSNFHPQLGSRGYYRSIFKHGVGEIEEGLRYTLGIVFHDYKDKPETNP